MLILKPENIDFQISTTNLIAKYSEDAKAEIFVEVLLKEDYLNREKYKEIKFEFDTVAEIRCKTVNFGESNYNNFQVLNLNKSDVDDFHFWQKNNYCLNSGFYSIENSEWLKEMNSLYDPAINLNLKHFLIEGYDSYIEILAKDYTIKTTANKV